MQNYSTPESDQQSSVMPNPIFYKNKLSINVSNSQIEITNNGDSDIGNRLNSSKLIPNDHRNGPKMLTSGLHSIQKQTFYLQSNDPKSRDEPIMTDLTQPMSNKEA